MIKAFWIQWLDKWIPKTHLPLFISNYEIFFYFHYTVLGFWRNTGKKYFLLSPLGNTLTILYVLAINKVANSIAYPPDHLGGLDSSSRIRNDSDVASEKFREVLFPDLGKSSRKKVFFSKEYIF